MDSEALISELERSQNAYVFLASDGQNSIAVRSKEDELDACYRLMREAATELRNANALMRSFTKELKEWDEVFETLGKPGKLGASKAESSLIEIERILNTWAPHHNFGGDV